MKLSATTNQEAFDTVVRHLRSQNRQATWDGNCVYRSEAGTSCAVGCLIPADQYTPKMEGYSVGELVRGDGVCGEAIGFTLDVGDVDVELLQELQWTHDTSYHWFNTEKAMYLNEAGRRELKRIATLFGLDGTLVDTLWVEKTGNEISGLRA